MEKGLVGVGKKMNCSLNNKEKYIFLKNSSVKKYLIFYTVCNILLRITETLELQKDFLHILLNVETYIYMYLSPKRKTNIFYKFYKKLYTIVYGKYYFLTSINI